MSKGALTPEKELHARPQWDFWAISYSGAAPLKVMGGFWLLQLITAARAAIM